MVYDGPAAKVDHHVLTEIYGDEDWSSITDRLARQEEESEATPPLILVAAS